MKVKPRSRKYIEDFASKVRNILKLSLDNRVNIVKIMEELLPALEIDYIYEDDENLPSEYAVYSPLDKCLRIRNSVYIGACNGDGRDRLTLGHELGHILLLHGEEAMLTRSTEKVPAYCDPEWQAFEFARNLLCPIEGIHSNDDEFTLSERYGISLAVAEIQLNHLKKK